MKKTIKFSKLFLHFFILSMALIALGAVGYFTKGINFGIDFQAGLIEKFKIAPTAVELSYKGPLSITIEQGRSDLALTSTALDGESKAFVFNYSENPTIGDMKAKLAEIEGLKVKLLAPESTALKDVFSSSESSSKLSTEIFRFHYIDNNQAMINADEVRLALSSVKSVLVQQLGEESERYFQVRMADDGKYKDANKELRAIISKALNSAYGEENIAIMGTDFVASKFSASLAWHAVLLVFGALILIFIYAMIRFQWNFALGAILSLVHDTIIMIAFIVWTQMEFSSITVAALLTIIGYSINDTIVIFDRIREKTTLQPKMECKALLDLALTEVFGRTIITTLTTMLAVLSLFIFTTGAMKSFALVLLIGLISGTYSSMYIASAFVAVTSKGKKASQLITRGKKAPGELSSGVTV